MDSNEMSLAVLKAEADGLRSDGVWAGFRWPDEFKNKVRALHKDGVSAGDIAAHTRITIDSVKAWVGATKPIQKKEKSFFQVPVKKIEIKKHTKTFYLQNQQIMDLKAQVVDFFNPGMILKRQAQTIKKT